MSSGNGVNTNRSADARVLDILYTLVKMLAEDIQKGFRPLIVCGIPKDTMEEFEKKIKSRGQDPDTEIRNFIFETIGRPVKKE